MSRLTLEPTTLERFTNWFNYTWGYIYKPSDYPSWQTFSNKFKPALAAIVNIWQDTKALIGLRFGRETNYCLLDIDRGSAYHPANSKQLPGILASLESIGLVRPVLVRSSFSDGLHIYFHLDRKVSSFSLAACLKYTLLESGYSIAAGQLETFPNVKAFNPVKPTNYNGHRLPLQPETGSWLLNADLQPESSCLDDFLNAADFSAAGNDTDLLLSKFAQALKKHKQKRFQAVSGDPVQWKLDLEKTFEIGWTGQGQTNDLIQKLVCYGIVFESLSGDRLSRWACDRARNLPGFSQWCGHQADLPKKVSDWVRATESNHYYSPYCSYPERLGRFIDVANSADSQVTRRNSDLNQERHLSAIERVKGAIAHLQANGGLPALVTERLSRVVATVRELFGVGVAKATLYKEACLELWHPKHTSDRVGNSTPEPVIAIVKAIEEPLEKLVETLEPLSDNNLPIPPSNEGLGDALPESSAPSAYSQQALNLDQGESEGDTAFTLTREFSLVKVRGIARGKASAKSRSLVSQIPPSIHKPSAAKLIQDYLYFDQLFRSDLTELQTEAIEWANSFPGLQILSDCLQPSLPLIDWALTSIKAMSKPTTPSEFMSEPTKPAANSQSIPASNLTAYQIGDLVKIDLPAHALSAGKKATIHKILDFFMDDQWYEVQFEDATLKEFPSKALISWVDLQPETRVEQLSFL